MAKLSRRRRQQLPSMIFACPRQRKYPLTDAVHVRNAASRYNQRRTTKCKGGLRRIKAAERRFGIK